ncbi:unnamed protein product [Haemonchus placei]|uniref:Uncharacterized protein n=1 Tax=Haemonchus placei TaxID=6290 RepID=A0A0N4VWE3_HAEPC|nr:unnamed protein product [Haemonchus placei]
MTFLNYDKKFWIKWICWRFSSRHQRRSCSCFEVHIHGCSSGHAFMRTFSSCSTNTALNRNLVLFFRKFSIMRSKYDSIEGREMPSSLAIPIPQRLFIEINYWIIFIPTIFSLFGPNVTKRSRKASCINVEEKRFIAFSIFGMSLVLDFHSEL